MPTPTIEEYKRAFLLIEPRVTQKQLEMLRAHYYAPNHTITMAELAKHMGYTGHNVANLHYGKLGRSIADLLNYKKERIGGESKYIDVLATENPNLGSYQQWEWVMRPEVARALKELKWV